MSELRQIVQVMTDGPSRSDMLAAELLAQAAAVLGTRRFSDMAEGLSAAAGILGAKAMDTRISNLHDAAEMLSIASRRIERRSGDW